MNHHAVFLALLSAALFGVSTPAAKWSRPGSGGNCEKRTPAGFNVSRHAARSIGLASGVGSVAQPSTLRSTI